MRELIAAVIAGARRDESSLKAGTKGLNRAKRARARDRRANTRYIRMRLNSR